MPKKRKNLHQTELPCRGSCQLMGYGTDNKEHTEKALEHFERALGIAERIKDPTSICNYLLAISSIQKLWGTSKPVTKP